MLATHKDAEQRYHELRTIALESAERNFLALGKENIKATIITRKALDASKLWSKSTARRVDWDWIDGYSVFKFRYPKRFEIALWQNSQLIGLSMGRPTYSAGTALRLDVVEAPALDLGERPAVLPFVLAAYTIYARLINASQVRIMHPINDAVKSYYTSLGYTYVGKGDYLYKEVIQ